MKLVLSVYTTGATLEPLHADRLEVINGKLYARHAEQPDETSVIEPATVDLLLLETAVSDGDAVAFRTVPQ